ncbi:hypothetical protein M404DRAFT_1003040 [Pisolithus tinctorius Marx 270]|uniref:Uncharacterized protein n=1 Tax=Pisolithus tinctorius Marx 270 TaxID=870435 RepID=A0A0C3P2X1_PISTI|nr:hypothetical protein M404DRAFT_1003040 [Pisolithus tinctorius Marx 270]
MGRMLDPGAVLLVPPWVSTYISDTEHEGMLSELIFLTRLRPTSLLLNVPQSRQGSRTFRSTFHIESGKRTLYILSEASPVDLLRR